MKFKVGDRVRHNEYGDGTVKVFQKEFPSIIMIGVEFDISRDFFHYLPYKGKSFSAPDKGYWCIEDELIKIEEEIMIKSNRNEEIMIKRNGNTVTAYMGNKQAVAKCSLTDTFDLYKGSILALTRLLLEGEENGGGKEL